MTGAKMDQMLNTQSFDHEHKDKSSDHLSKSISYETLRFPTEEPHLCRKASNISLNSVKKAFNEHTNLYQNLVDSNRELHVLPESKACLTLEL